MKAARIAVHIITLAAGLVATLPSPSRADGQFGPNVQKLHIPFSAFHSRFPSAFTPAYNCCNDGYVWPFAGTPGLAALVAPIDASQLPSGAHITQMRAFIRDGTAVLDEDIMIALCRTGVGELAGNFPEGDCPVVLFSDGSHNDYGITVAADHVVEYTTSGFLVPPVSWVYTLVVEFGTATKIRQYIGDELRLRQVVIYFERQIRPRSTLIFPPTFDDVPEDSPIFDEVEALYAAGISAGCDPNNYCPDAPVTRGQLALLMARALGLNWP